MKRRPGGQRPRKTPKQQALPLTSSSKVVAALRRLGFYDGPENSGSHMTMWRPRPDGGKDVTTVVLGASQIPRGTLKSILRLAKVSQGDFVAALRKGRR